MATNYTANYSLPYPQLFDPSPRWTEDQADCVVTIDALIKDREDELLIHASDPQAHGAYMDDVFDVDAAIVSSKQVTLSEVPVNGTEWVILNGIIMVKGPSRDYTISSKVVTFDSGRILTVGDVIYVKYIV